MADIRHHLELIAQNDKDPDSVARLQDLLKNSDDKIIKERAMPKAKTTISPARRARVEHMLELGYVQADIARMLDISESSVSNILKESKQVS